MKMLIVYYSTYGNVLPEAQLVAEGAGRGRRRGTAHSAPVRNSSPRRSSIPGRT